MVTLNKCPNTGYALSTSYRFFGCKCIDCKNWKRLNSGDPVRAAERSRVWRLRYPERSRSNARRYLLAHPRVPLVGKCDICAVDTKLCRDHDHVSGKRRGNLCTQCNLMLGMAKDSRANLLAAEMYLQRWGAE